DQGEAKLKLELLKKRLLERHICQIFADKNQLATKVVADIGRHVASQLAPLVGPGMPLPDIGVVSQRGPVFETPDEWKKRRRLVYETNGGVFLTHFIEPSRKPGQLFNVFIYLIRHQSEDLSDIAYAEFFMGKYWNNEVFRVGERDGFIGIATAAYGT